MSSAAARPMPPRRHPMSRSLLAAAGFLLPALSPAQDPPPPLLPPPGSAPPPAAVGGAAPGRAPEALRKPAAPRVALLRGCARIDRGIPRDPFAPASVAASLGPNPEKAFAWVRDHTAFVPYRGALRGPVGVLMDRSGNSLDRSLLLARLLQIGGRRARLARGNLDEALAGAGLARGRGA